MEEMLISIEVALIATIVFIGLVIGGAVIIGSISCSQLGKNVGMETDFEIFGGGSGWCLIKVDGKWIPTDIWRLNTGN